MCCYVDVVEFGEEVCVVVFVEVFGVEYGGVFEWFGVCECGCEGDGGYLVVDCVCGGVYCGVNVDV